MQACESDGAGDQRRMHGVLDVAAIRAPGFGQRRKAYLQDIVIATGLMYLAKEVGITLNAVARNMLGTCNWGRVVS